jgi:preprotein translocase subunit YajC
MKKTLIAALLLGASFVPAAVSAQGVPAPVAEILTVGATVHGPQGGEVGKIEKIEGGNVVIFTGTQRATLPASALGRDEKGLVISMTKAQLDSAVAEAEAKANATLDAALAIGADVTSSDGVKVATVQKIDGDNVIVDLASGTAITLQKSHLSVKDGGLTLLMTAGQLQSAVSAAAGQATTG